jgi:hypothetical protein
MSKRVLMAGQLREGSKHLGQTSGGFEGRCDRVRLSGEKQRQIGLGTYAIARLCHELTGKGQPRALPGKIRENGPGAGLIGVILPNHDDFKRPFYEPELVPLRLHEFITQQVAILKKWPHFPTAMQPWLEDAEWRRRAFQRRTRVSLSTLKLIREHHWTNEGDEPREALFTLSAQHAPKSDR